MWGPSRSGSAVAVCLVLALSTGTVGVSAAAAATETPTTAAAAQEAGSGAETACGYAPGVAGALCDTTGAILGDGVGLVVGSGADAVLASMVGFVVDGAVWLLEQLAAVIDASTRPDLRSGWFRVAYGDMALVGMLGLLPFLLLALLQALIRQDAGMMLRAAFGYVPLAALGTAGAIVVTDLLVTLTDQLSGWIARGLGSDLEQFTTGVGTALARLSAPSGGAVAGLAALVAAALVAFSTFVIWLELLLRQAAIHVAVLFLPLAFMAMVWPATAHWVRRLTQGLVAIILSKFVIVAVIAMAASALDADVADEGFGVVMSGGALLGLAALAPYVLLRLIPVFDAGMSSQLEGTFRRPTAAVAPPSGGSRVTGLIRQRVGGGAHAAVAPTRTTGRYGTTGVTRTGPASVGAATAASAGVGVATAGIVAGGRVASGTARRAAHDLGESVAGANGSAPPSRTAPRATGAGDRPRPGATTPRTRVDP